MSGIGIFSGRIAQEPEIRVTPNGNAYCKNTIFVWTSKNDPSGEKKPDGTPKKVDLPVNITAWGDEAQQICQNFRKGDVIHLQGYADVNVFSPKDAPEKTVKAFDFKVAKGGILSESQARDIRKSLTDALKTPERQMEAHANREMEAQRSARSMPKEVPI